MIKLRKCGLICQVFLILTSCIAWLQCHDAPSQTLTIASAANLQPVMEPLQQAFDSIQGRQTRLILNASGKITTQILHGAPYDVFLSADMHFPQELAAAHTTEGSPIIYTRGQLVLWSHSPIPIEGLHRLLDPDVRHIAIANPEVAPYGKAAMEVLEHEGYLERVRDKLVFGESVGQATQFVQSGAAEIGFTSGSYRFSPSISGSAQWYIVPDSLYQPIEQGAVIILKQGVSHPEAKTFLTFLRSPIAQEIFRNYGYLPVVNE